eukprot:7972245-Pyramimonas_sp.AAC.1
MTRGVMIVGEAAASGAWIESSDAVATVNGTRDATGASGIAYGIAQLRQRQGPRPRTTPTSKPRRTR